jgi:hypothetical protein
MRATHHATVCHAVTALCAATAIATVRHAATTLRAAAIVRGTVAAHRATLRRPKLAASAPSTHRQPLSPPHPAPVLTGVATGPCHAAPPVNRVAGPSLHALTPQATSHRLRAAPRRTTSPTTFVGRPRRRGGDFFKKIISIFIKFGCNLNRFD